MNLMNCRDAAIEDAAAIGRVSVEAWRAAYAGLMPAAFLAGLDPTGAAAQFALAIGAGYKLLVLDVEDAVAGFSVYGASRDTDAAPHTGEVLAINLLPSHWRRGGGTLLLEETTRRLQQMRFSDAMLWVLHDNARARRFYEASGWRHDGGEKRDDTLTGFPLHEVRYRRSM